MRPSHPAGFSLIEALVVLAIGGMALSVVFSIGIKAGDSGFALGRRALSAADADLATSDLRSLIRSLELRPGFSFVENIDSPLSGTPEQITGTAVMEQANLCAPAGWSGRLTLELQPTSQGAVLSCIVDGKSTTIITWAKGEKPSFSYSEDGLTWTETYQSDIQGPLDAEFHYEEPLWIRLSIKGGPDTIEQTSSGQPARWIRPDVPY